MEDAGRPNWFVLKKDRGTCFATTRGLCWSDPDGGAGSMDGLSDSVTGNINGGSGTGRCIMNCNNDSEPYSFHAAGMNIGMADGSVRFITESVVRGHIRGTFDPTWRRSNPRRLLAESEFC